MNRDALLDSIRVVLFAVQAMISVVLALVAFSLFPEAPKHDRILIAFACWATFWIGAGVSARRRKK